MFFELESSSEGTSRRIDLNFARLSWSYDRRFNWASPPLHFATGRAALPATCPNLNMAYALWTSGNPGVIADFLALKLLRLFDSSQKGMQDARAQRRVEPVGRSWGLFINEHQLHIGWHEVRLFI